MNSVIDCQGLSKRYAGTPTFALRDLTLQVGAGEIYGFIGPNGAGKSTAIRTLLNFLQPTAGQATILGLDSVLDSVKIKRQIGYLAGEIALYPRLTGRQFLDYMAALQPVSQPEYFQHLIKQFGAQLDKPLHELSKGNRQKLGLIQALMHQPKVLILDEPTSGLDPLMQAEFYKVIQATKLSGATIFLSSHDLTEVRKMCDRVGFIRGGRLVSEQTIADMQRTAAHSFDISFKNEAPLAELRKLPSAKVTPLTEHTVAIRLSGDLKPLFKLLATKPVVTLDKHEVDLEEEFMQLYAGNDQS